MINNTALRQIVIASALALGAPVGAQTQAVSYNTDFLALAADVAANATAAVRFGPESTMFLSGRTIQLHSSAEIASGEPFDTASISGWPQGWDSVDAAYAQTDTSAVLIRGSDFVVLSYDPTAQAVSVAGPPKPLTDLRIALPEAWGATVDAAVQADAETVLFFRNDEFIAVNFAKGISSPAKFTEWEGWPQGWDRIDAAANPGYGMLYFFRDGAYVAFDQSTGRMADFPPQSMAPDAPLVDAIEDRLEPKSSTVENKSVHVTIANRSSQDMEVLWVDFEGALKPYARLRPFEEYVQQTFDGHLWYARQGDAIVAAYKASTADTQHFFVFDASIVAYPVEQEAVIDPKQVFTNRNDAILPFPNSDWVGAGFHLAYVDPADISAKGRPGTPPARRRPPINLLLSSDFSKDGRYMRHHGVRLESGTSVSDEEESRIITSVEDLSSSLSLGFTQGLDIGIAGFSRALSYEHVNDSSTGRDSIFMLHRVVARNEKLVMDIAWPTDGGVWRRQQLDPDFVSRVARLGAECRDGYEQLLQAYGSHYASSVTFGGQYNQLTRIDKSQYNRFEGNRADFEQHLRATLPDTPVSVSSSQSAGGGQSQGAQGSDERTSRRVFGSGGRSVENRDQWLESIAKEPSPVSIEFDPITKLLTQTFFPDDPRIYAKQETFRTCAEAEYALLGQTYESRAARNAEPFFEKEIPAELKKKTPDYRYVVDARIVGAKDQCNRLYEPERQAAWLIAAVSSGVALGGAFPGKSDMFVDFNLNYGGAFTAPQYLCLVTNDSGPPLTRLYPISQNAHSGTSSCRDGDRRLPTNINDKWNNFGQNDYICVGSNPNEYPLYDVQFRSAVGAVPDYAHQASSAGMVLNAGDILLYLHTQDVKQASDAGRIPAGNVDRLSALAIR